LKLELSINILQTGTQAGAGFAFKKLSVDEDANCFQYVLWLEKKIIVRWENAWVLAQSPKSIVKGDLHPILAMHKHSN
jgi:hypothetical protein